MGGTATLRHGFAIDKETGEKVKYYFTRADIEKLKLPEKFLAKRSNGMEVGLIRFDMKGKRKLVVPYKEEFLIELLKNNELVAKQGSGQRLTNKISWFDPEVDKLERVSKTKGKQLAILVAAQLPKSAIRDISLCLGIPECESIDEPDFAQILETRPERVMDLIEKPTSTGGTPKSKGVLESTRVEAALRRAIANKVVSVRAGAIYFEGEMIGTDFRTALKNLQNKTKGDDASFANVLPLITAKLKGDDD